jgi:chaperonin GroEL
MHYQKPKSVSKQMLSRGEELQSLILETLKTCSDLVGSTLGPGGMSVVIERQEVDMPPIVTKDGVTVFKALGFESSAAQVLMESARDCAVRTASEAGDGTTTATILAESFARKTQEFCKKNRHVSPQRVSRILQKFFDTDLEPQIRRISIMPDSGTEEGQKLLHGVARISANGDSELADATMKAFEIIGDAGNVTIVENMGPSGYIVEKIDGYPVPVGYEDCCGPFLQKFVNDVGTQMCVMEKPSFILYHGKITDFNIIYQALGQIAQAASEGIEVQGCKLTHNVVIVASGFSETVLANLAAGFVQEGTLNIYPLRVPPSPLKTGAWDFLADIAALTSATILDPIERPFQNFELDHLGVGISVFEAGRFRSNIIGHLDELLVLGRVDEITKQLAELQCSELDKTLMRERVAKLTSGIAKLVVTGSSHGEVKERRDRAEDAVCAVRGAIKHGVLPGGGTVLAYLSKFFEHEVYMAEEGDKKLIAREVVAPALLEPVIRLFLNAGYSEQEAEEKISLLTLNTAYDILERKFVDPMETYLLDSTPAVLEALRNSMSIAGNMGTCGGVIVFKTDNEVNRREARDLADFVRHSGINEADERG